VAVKAFLDDLQQFVVQAKALTYAADLEPGESSRPQSNDRGFEDGRFRYLDSAVGGTHFIGQELVYLFGEPVWAMNYHGRIIDPSYSPADVGRVIQASLTALYEEGRFLGGFESTLDGFGYVDVNDGDIEEFVGHEIVEFAGRVIYRLRYHGGLVRTWTDDELVY